MFRNGATTGTAFADFDANHRTLAGGAQGSGPGSHLVQAGETLQGIAAAYYGDAGLWYKIAEANGISGGAITAGQRLTVPQGINNSYHNASTFTPYDPARALGDVAPPGALPPKGGKGCGMVGDYPARRDCDCGDYSHGGRGDCGADPAGTFSRHRGRHGRRAGGQDGAGGGRGHWGRSRRCGFGGQPGIGIATEIQENSVSRAWRWRRSAGGLARG